MRNRILVTLITCSIISIGFIYILFILSETSANTSNGFLRKPDIHILKPHKKIDLTFNSYYIAGFSDDSVYLGNNTAPNYLLTVDKNLIRLRTRQIDIKSAKRVAWRSMKLSVNHPDFFLTEGSTPIHFKGKLPQLKASEVKIEKTIFDKPKVLNTGGIVFRTNDTDLKQNILTKEWRNGKEATRFVLKKQTDGYFSTDGSLLFDRKSNKLVYLYFYRNSFTILDSNLTILRNARTIDTTTTVKIHLGPVKSSEIITMTEPPKIINSQGAVHNDQLFVYSKLRSDNEVKSIFKNNFVIDVYSLISGLYLNSFYIPKLSYKRISHFEIHNNELFVIYNNFLYKFNLPK